MLKIYEIIYKIAKIFGFKFVFFIRYLLYRKAVLEPENLFLLNNSELAFLKQLFNIKKKDFKKIDLNNINIGFVGAFSHNFSFPSGLFKNIRKNSFFSNKNIFIYEFIYDNNNMSKIASENNLEYKMIDLNINLKGAYSRIFKDTYDYNYLSRTIKDDKIDLLIFSYESTHRYTSIKLLNTLSCLCIGFNWGNTFIAHPLMKIQSKIQTPPCWKVENNKLLHSSGKIIDNYIFIKDLFFYDKRDIVVKNNVKEEFENIIFVHGRLSKLYQIGYLDIISTLLINNKDLKFIFMGYDDQNSLSKIYDYFTKNKLIDRIEYSGSYSQAKNKDGIIIDKNWEKCKFYLKNSALYLNPFPKGSGSSRIEAFASGLPVIDYEIDFMDCSKRSEKAYILEPLIKKFGTGYTKEEYLNLAQKTLNDIQYRKNIINEQYKIVNDFCDEYVFWNKIENTIKKYHNV
ncbi:hypothetical protein ACN09X_08730 [Aliarcobacter butzleri]|uniref:hypothetical protein n=1 Tax=Aliarcobacter butzleri TaxID=28197 RepID=UPI003AED24B3